MAADPRQIKHSVARLILLALGLSVVMAVELASGQGFLKALLAGELAWQSIALVAFMVLASTAAIINAFTASMRPDPMRTAGTIASCALALVFGIEASQNVTPLPTMFYFCMSLAAQVLFTFATSFVVLRTLRLTGRLATQPAYVAAGVVLLVGAAGFVGQSFITLETVIARLSMVRDIALFGSLTGLLAATGLSASLRLDQKSIKRSILLRLPTNESEPAQRRMLAIAFVGFGLTMVLSVVANATTDVAMQSVLVLNLGWLGIVSFCVSELSVLTSEQRQGHVAARLATDSAQRFLKRHSADRQAWAATVGLRTTNFHIDHDPGGFLHSRLPASVMQIRAEEIQRCVNDVLKASHLHSHVVGHRIFGAIDPETSFRPCVDALKMFACLYLDAGPLVERRIKGLTALLPIVDPGLARLLKPTDISALIRRNLWFFHFDFGWIDQAVVHTPKSTRYDVRMATLSSSIRHAMMEHLEKTGGVGNFVWLGPDARERLLQEAPALRNIIEACPIPTKEEDKREGQSELLMFIIKFEQLIPRLQRYYDLDTMRKALLDFEPSQESARLLNLLSLQVAKARTENETLEVLDSLTSVPWRGFREKDNALQLILASYNSLSAALTPGKSLSESEDPRHKALHEKMVEAVRAVGYPSQILHNAQISKIALRDNQTLKLVASDPKHPRFHEAWLLLATSDYTRYDVERRKDILEFLASFGGLQSLEAGLLPKVKAIDAMASLGRVASEGEFEHVGKAASRVTEWLTSGASDLEILGLLLDALLFLREQSKGAIEIDAKATAALDGVIRAKSNAANGSDPSLFGVTTRWQDLNSRKKAGQDAA